MQTAVQTIEERPVAPVYDNSGNVLAVIERAALNPDIDITKLERLLEMQERIVARDARAAFAAAFAEMQPELPIIQERGGIKDRTGKVQSTYALWEDVNEAIKPVLARYGFGISFRTRTAEVRIHVTGILMHKAGHSEETEIDLMADNSGSKNAVQSIGSSVSYGKRYTAFALLNLTSAKSEDDDGQAAGAGGKINEEQLSRLRALADEVTADLERFCKYFGIEALPDLPVSRFPDAIAALEAKRAKA